MTVPTSTYRIQLRPEFGFDDVARVAPYLADLGISHVYLSPHLQAAAGSTHGYDIVDHSHVNEELGGEAAHERMRRALQEHGLSQLVDIVPNHMAIPGRANAWWWDVLKNGASSVYANYFDIDWALAAGETEGRVLLPVLGRRYGEVLAGNEFKIAKRPDGPVVAYYDAEFPLTGIDVAEVDELLEHYDADRLHAVLERQHYRLAYWRLASEELEYRRFFDINSLMALRTEDPEVFAATHALISKWVESGAVAALRVDHVDGLSNPAEYLQRVREMLGSDGYLVVEKILEPGERLRSSWPIDGTTGYEAARLVDGLFVDPEGEAGLERVFRNVTKTEGSWDSIVKQCKRLVVRELFGSDVARLTDQLHQVCEQHPEARDFSRRQMRDVLRELLVQFAAYRSYVVPETSYVAEDDLSLFRDAANAARTELSDDRSALIDFVVRLWSLEVTGQQESAFVKRFQQTSGPIMAKGVEDTAGYRFNRLISLNEVGGAPDRFGTRPDEFHEACADALKNWPYRMVAGTTHDTKRSEDVRTRLSLLSEIPEQWEAAVNDWLALAQKHLRDDVDGMKVPDPATLYLLFQTMVGAYPIAPDRLSEYMLKAVREMRLFSSWQEPNESFEAGLTQFVEAIATDSQFQQSLSEFVKPLIGWGRLNSLAATVVRLTMPGIPDVYQGSEEWILSLVDPDNRRPVDYNARTAALAETESARDVPDLTDDDEGRTKLFVLSRLLRLRRSRPDLFDDRSSYLPVVCAGDRSANVLAFRRGELLVFVPRLVVSLNDDWRDTYVDLPDGAWDDVFTGVTYRGRVELRNLLSRVAVSCLLQAH